MTSRLSVRKFSAGLLCPDSQDKLVRAFLPRDSCASPSFFDLSTGPLGQIYPDAVLISEENNKLVAGIASAMLGKSTRCVKDSPPQPPAPLTRELLGYWIQHPESMGTVEAMAEWWLLEHRIQQSAIELRSILSDLVANGFVVRREEADGRIYYQLNREMEAEIIAWLQSK